MPAEPLDQTPAEELQAIAAEVRRLSPSWQRPELFHEAKSELGARLMRLSRRLDLRPAIPLRIAPVLPVRPRYTAPPSPPPQPTRPDPASHATRSASGAPAAINAPPLSTAASRPPASRVVSTAMKGVPPCRPYPRARSK
jgi:hypothetical protein